MPARTIKDILKKRVIKGIERTSRKVEALNAVWRTVVPARFAGHTRVMSYKRRILEVAVDSPAVLAEMEGFHHRAIGDALNKALSADGITPPVRIKYTVEADT